MSFFEQYNPNLQDEELPEPMDDTPMGQHVGQHGPERCFNRQIDRRPLIDITAATLNLEGLSLHSNTLITIIFDRGRMSAVIDKNTLAQSRQFLFALQNPQTRTLWLRNDFPFGAKAMLEFIATGTYTFDVTMPGRYPLVTMLDLHVHAYLASIKYDIPHLSSHAMAAFLDMAAWIIRLDFVSDNPDTYTRFFDIEYDFSSGMHFLLPIVYDDHTAPARFSAWALRAPYLPNDGSGAAHVDRLLNAIVLLWRNTAAIGPDDAMRRLVIRVVKQGLGRLMQLRFFVFMLRTLDSFGEEVVRGLQEDGLVVRVVEQNWVGSSAVGVRFEAGCEEDV